MIYLKLGPNASVFFDPSSQLLIRGGEVIAVEKLPKTKKYGLASRSGHVAHATKEEYDAFLSKTGVAPAKFVPTPPIKGKKDKTVEVLDDYEYNPELLKKTPDEIREMIINEGFMDEDIKKFEGLTDVKEMIKLFDQVNKEYS